MWLGIAVFLLVLWAILKLAVGVVSFFIHILIILAVIAVIWHFVAADRSRM